MKKTMFFLPALLFLSSLFAQDTTETVELMFVQNAKKIKVKDGKLTLNNIGATTLYFADRPSREIGHMTTEDFVANWGVGENNFKIDPPNTVLSIFENGEISNVVMVLKNPVYSGKNLVYEIETLEGKLESGSEECSLFIDPVGRPASPTSVAGV